MGEAILTGRALSSLLRAAAHCDTRGVWLDAAVFLLLFFSQRTVNRAGVRCDLSKEMLEVCNTKKHGAFLNSTNWAEIRRKALKEGDFHVASTQIMAMPIK